MDNRPPVPPRVNSYSKPRGPRPQQHQPPPVPPHPTMTAAPPPPPARRVARKPVGSAPGHPLGPRPLSQRIAPPPQHPTHHYETPHPFSTPNLASSTPKTPYPVSPEQSPKVSPVTPYPVSPLSSPKVLDSRIPVLPPPNTSTSSLSSGHSLAPSISPIAIPVQPYTQNAPYPIEDPFQSQTINVADMDDVVVYSEDFDDVEINESASMDTLPLTTDASSIHSSVPSLLKPGGMQLNLPEIPPLVAVRPKFSAEWLGVPEFERCRDISRLSAIASWLLYLINTIEAEYNAEGIINALAKLFTFNVHTIDWIQAEILAQQAFRSLQGQGFIYGNEEIALQQEVYVSGVLTTLCGTGCYSPHFDTHYSCYSSRCLKEKRVLAPTRELSRRGSISVKEGSGPKGLFESEWHIFWGIPSPKGEEITKAVKRQYAIHENIYTESLYVHDLQVFVNVYGRLRGMTPSIMKKQAEFCAAVFDKVSDILALQKVLFAKLKYRQTQQGPYVKMVADLVLEWALKADNAYTSYAEDYLWTDAHLRTEMRSSPAVEKWLAESGHSPELKGKPFQFFFNRVIPRALRYKLLLETIKKHTPASDPEYEILERAIEATNNIGKKCDEAVDKATKSQELQNINATIVFKDKSVEVDLRLRDSRRKLIKRGKMLRKSGYGIDWLETDVLLMDNFLILAKMREGQSGNSLYITKKPIYLDLLVLESKDDEPITNFSFLSGNSGAFTAVQNIDGRPRNLDDEGGEQFAIYPFKITHLGRGGGTYTLYTATQIEREQWCNSIIEAKTAISASAYARNSQPFLLRKLSDSFGYNDNDWPKLPVPVNSTAMTRCIGQDKPPTVIAKSRVNCAASFGRDYYLAGLENGLYFCKDRNVREWTRCLILPIDTMRVVPEFNFVMVLSRGQLIWYRLDEVVNRGFVPYPDKHSSPQGQRITQQNKITHFNLAIIRDRLHVLYQVGGSKKVIHLLEPIRAKAMIPSQYPTDLAKQNLGNCIDFNVVDYFREVGVYEPVADMIGFTPLLQSVILQTTKGFLHMNYESHHVQKVPVNNVVLSEKGKSLNSLTGGGSSVFGPAMGIFRVSADSLLLCYRTCCAQCTNNGRLILPLTKFLCVPEQITFHAPYLIVVSPELVEIRLVDINRNAKTRAKLCQVITGTDIVLLGSIEGQVRLSMAHPTLPGRQLVVELLINDFVNIDESSSLVTL